MKNKINKFFCTDKISVEKLDNFFIEKSPFINKDGNSQILFSDYICRNNKFNNKILLNFFPKLVTEILKEEFDLPLNNELIDILIKDFNISDFKTFSIPCSNSIENEFFPSIDTIQNNGGFSVTILNKPELILE